jgi:hypothetical protein
MLLRVLVGVWGLALVLYGGSRALMPVVTLGALLWALERTNRDRYVYAFAAGGAYVFWAIAGIFLVGRSAVDWAIEGVVAAVPLAWLWFKPQSAWAAAFCLVVFLLEFAITGVSIALARAGTRAHEVLVTHGSLKGMVLLSLVVGFVKSRRQRRRDSSDARLAGATGR